MCSHGSELIEQPVCFVGYSASDFAGSAAGIARYTVWPSGASQAYHNYVNP